jgi:hypothetical protein
VKCNEVVILEAGASDRIVTTLRQSYAKAEHSDEEIDDLVTIVSGAIETSSNLVQIDIAIIVGILALLDLPIPKVLLSSEIGIAEDATDRVIKICTELQTKSLIIGHGKSMEVHDLSRIQNSGISIYTQDFISLHPKYSQSRRRRLPFTPGLSIVDSILNVGREATMKFLTNEDNRPALMATILESR